MFLNVRQNQGSKNCENETSHFNPKFCSGFYMLRALVEVRDLRPGRIGPFETYTLPSSSYVAYFFSFENLSRYNMTLCLSKSLNANVALVSKFFSARN